MARSKQVDHRAWVAGLPVWFARSVGWMEIGCAVSLAVSVVIQHRAMALWSSFLLVVNQVIAFAVHATRHEVAEAGPQNVILILLLSGYWAYACFSPAKQKFKHTSL